ncbi:MAG: hypothetical protein JWR61_3318 [Ferruginibacter sp.]|uniref:sensor histidine kinase n=1 Tax=Ferruginibacter sp. TaxID=1940288 RepID=UPI002658348D|nr:ATP-binding protein [Ferruginibacter sp.]MDB5278363.1 hypothetical protein [Ferruginibacter sp.]
MNQHLQHILQFIEQNNNMTAEEKNALLKSIKDADKEFEITAFKLDRTEKVKKTTAILLEETIEELEHKQRAVEAQNRELEIEASLERVRTIAMGMSTPEDLLNISQANYKELTKLGFSEIRNSLIGIFHDDKNYFTDYDYSDFSGGSITNIPYNKNSIIDKSVQQMKSATDAFTEFIVEGTELEEWKAFRKQNGEYEDTRLKDTSALYYYFYSIEQGNVGISTFKKISEEQLNILKRFRNVFDLAYKRYTDITTAAAQAREAEIELALERVRARTMAMQHSDELADASLLLDSQVRMLGIKTRGCGFNIYGDKESTEWFSSEMGTMPTYKTPREGVFLRYYKEGQTGKSMYIETFTGEACAAHYKYLCTLPVLGDGLRKLTESGGSFPVQQIDHVTYFKYGYLLFITLEPAPDAHDIFIRFAKVFEQTYTRFLDLQKAEAQAKEAMIEAALESVRSASLAMHQSNQLKTVASVMFKKWTELGLNLSGAFIFLFDRKTRDIQLWIATTTLSEPGEINIPFTPAISKNAIFNDLLKVMENGELIFNRVYAGKDKNDYFRYVAEHNTFPPELKDFHHQAKSWTTSLAGEKHAAVGFDSWDEQLATAEDFQVLKRFSKVFEQAYVRFLDLQKAEEQARESQIQLALERVRARTMAMQHSDELTEAANLLFRQVQTLGIPVWSCGFNIWQKNEKVCIGWMSTKDELQPPFTIPLTESPTFQRFYQSKQLNEEFYTEEVKDDALEAHYRYMRSLPGFERIMQQHMDGGFKLPQSQVNNVANFAQGNLIFITCGQVPWAWDIFKRFAGVFEQTYTRFLDLQKAEAQAREAEIELALERVRARTMAMQKSDELAQVASLLFAQVITLGINCYSSGFTVWENENTELISWMCNADGSVNPPFKMPAFDIEWHKQQFQSWKNQEEYIIHDFTGNEMQEFYRYLRSFPLLDEAFKKSEAAGVQTPVRQVHNAFNFSHGNLLFITLQPSPESYTIFKRFAKVFEQTYTRFLDLQRAEAQAREAQIEASLERVRSRSMAMHQSAELTDVANVLFQQLRNLGGNLWGCGFVLCKPASDDDEVWFANENGVLPPIAIPHTKDATHKKMYEGWKNKMDLCKNTLEGKALNDHYDYMLSVPSVKTFFENILASGLSFPTRQTWHAAYFKYGYVLTITLEEYPDEQVFIRFAKVFEQAYTRFLDLQKAEAQTREAEIELALERVRARTMAMQHSDELQAASLLLFRQVESLGLPPLACGFNIWDDDRKAATAWMGSISGLLPPFKTDSSKDVYQKIYEAAQTGKPLFVIEQSGKELEVHYQYLATIPTFREVIMENWRRDGVPIPTFQIIHCVYFTHGYLMFISFERVAAYYEIFKRFAKVFEQTYTRFLDLQKAESQAREAQIEGALEKVRSRTLAMQKSDELAETAAVLFQQLIALGIEPNRLYISIVKDENGASEFWITDEDGTKISTAFKANLNDNVSFAKMFEGWKQQKKSLVINMQGDELQNYFRHLTSLGVPFKNGLSQKRRVQDIAYFSKGFIGIASPDDQPKETLQLLERFAAVFNLTFTRFNDLQIAEAHALQAEEDLIVIKDARQKAEAALTELQATQKQLIQSEKMASLGELTAGIAHEIQNPLNFVNNFSEVSKELLGEMREAMDKGDAEEAKEIMNDLIQNLEKINHHGKRADGIVKGMLQHSRSSSSHKEPTDINALADEYLRLAYHGLRAKDKSFNATLKTNYDDAIGTINIVPQDIGRVILNLISNAFYAVNEKNQSLVANPAAVKYEPTVSVSTKKINDQIEISVADNGNGIPSPVKDKIFQPFFTTKPTGQGTGLGLSLVYDIVKAHGGELRVKTNENEGAEFLVQLPAN